MKNDRDQSIVIKIILSAVILLYAIVGFYMWVDQKSETIKAVDAVPSQERLNNIALFSQQCVRAGGIPDISQNDEMYCHIGEATHGYQVSEKQNENNRK